MSEKGYNYIKYRGKCKEACEELVAKDPSLTMVRGHYWCPIWNSDEPHWWCVDPEGNVVDPTKLQFPSVGAGYYTPFSGYINCESCGAGVVEEEAYIVGNHTYCGYTCYGHDIGF